MPDPGPEPAPWTRHLPPGVDADDVDLIARASLPAAWVARWRHEPARPVLRDVDGTWLDGSDMLERTAGLGRRLLEAGLRRGDRLVVSGGISADVVVAHVAALRAGLVVVPVNPAYARREVEVIVAEADPRGALVEDGEMAAWLRSSRIAVVDTPAGALVTDEVSTTAHLDADGAAAAGLDAVGPDDPALLPFTSGTTGRPKGALLTHGNLLASAEAVVLAWRWTAEDRLILALPLFHMHGLGVGIHGTLLAGASAVLLERFDPAVVVDEAAAGATMFFGVPTMYARLVDADGAGRLAELRLCVSGSAPLSAEVHRRVEAVCGQRVLERYGMTETVMLVSNPYDGERRAGTVGIPLPGVELRLDPETSEIEVRGPNVFGGYFERPDADAEAFRPDGWFRTGDIGAVDADGYVSIVGRAKELIITGGFNVYPREVEDVLRAVPGVSDVAVVGTPSQEWGEIVTAYVEAPEGTDVEALVAAAADHLVAYKRPRLVHRVDALPRNAMGKVVRGRLG